MSSRLAATLGGALVASGGACLHDEPPDERAGPAPAEPVATFNSVPVGVASSSDGRVFLAFSRAIDPAAPYSVAELQAGGPVLFPPGFEQDAGGPDQARLLSVQSVFVDARDRLWILDSGKVGNRPVAPASPKLIAYDLKMDEELVSLGFPPEVAGPTSFLNDVRLDLGRGEAGVAYITDASSEGPNAIVVIDLATGIAMRRLEGHPSVIPEPKRTLVVQGTPLVEQRGRAKGQPLRLGVDGIALSADGKYVYYSPLTSHRLYRVSADALADPTRTDEEVAATVEDLGDKGFAADGLLGDAQGRLYVTDLEHSAIRRRAPDGRWQTVMHDPSLHWPDTLALQPDGTLLFTVTQIDRSARFRGRDRRVRPFSLYRVETDSRPQRLDEQPPPQVP
jgi:sugar lactone lactonase YvrE